MAALEENEDFFKHFLLKNENTICDLSNILQERYPEQKGFSVRSIFIHLKTLFVGEKE